MQGLHLGNNPRHQHRLGSSSAGKDLEVLVDNKLSLSQQCALGARRDNEILASIGNSIASMSRSSGVILPLYSALVKHIWSAVSGSGSSGQEGHGAPGAGPTEATEMLKGLEHLS
ncbi:hypothetical protein WISP_35032 [Willisornis vidua]|uniref:Uncharacterized protein n=1 Tax=Willisornis vidua TaxID=1566151 RepID=A0ABQ9DJI9_9PASS|nr:hypothetical protein WISP_35032 [Willisornis vidua]